MSKNKHKGNGDEESSGEYGLAIQRNANGTIVFGPLADQKRKEDVMVWELRTLAKEYLEVTEKINIATIIRMEITRALRREAGLAGAGVPPVPLGPDGLPINLKGGPH